MKRLDERYIFGLLQTEAPYSDSNPAPRARRHDLTWKTADFTPDGVPLTQEGASKVFLSQLCTVLGYYILSYFATYVHFCWQKFGLGVLPNDSADAVQLKNWHTETTMLHGQFLREQQDRERRQRERELLQFNNLNNYVAKRSQAIDRF